MVFEVDRVFAAAPEALRRSVDSAKVLEQLPRFDPYHQSVPTTYLSWSLYWDCGGSGSRFPKDPEHQLRSIARTVRREHQRTEFLRNEFGWMGDNTKGEALLERLIYYPDTDPASPEENRLKSLMMVATAAYDGDRVLARWLVDESAQLIPECNRTRSRMDSLQRYLQKELGDKLEHKSAASVELEQLCAGEFHEIVSWAELFEGDGSEFIDFDLFPAGFTTDREHGALAVSENRRPSRYDERRLGIIYQLRDDLEYRGSVCKIIKPSDDGGSESYFGWESADYHVLTVCGSEHLGEHAVAISPISGEHAIYIARADVSLVSWREVFSHSKDEARTAFGARRILVPYGDELEYGNAVSKVLALLRCPAEKFRGTLSPYWDNYTNEWMM